MAEKKKAIENAQEAFSQTKMEYEEKISLVKDKENLLQTLTTGMTQHAGRDHGYIEQLQGNFFIMIGRDQK